MKLKALSHYDNDMDTRFGDCILLYLVSDNSGSGKTSGGSDKLVDFMKKEKYNAAHNTKNGIVELPLLSASVTLKSAEKERVCLGDLDCVK